MKNNFQSNGQNIENINYNNTILYLINFWQIIIKIRNLGIKKYV
jgi:hypothetical protein